ncbi:unnamed protein product, partial [Phaeothamnion confervicola]
MGELGFPGALQPGVFVHRRMAGDGRGTPVPARPSRHAGNRRAGSPGGLRRAFAGGARMAAVGLGFLAALVAFTAFAADQIVATRIWPAPDYTRVTLESKNEIRYTLFAVNNPERLVLDLEGIEMSAVLADLNNKVTPSDPYIEKLRVAVNRPGVTRLVLDLKAVVKAQAFTIKPVADYGHRLVLDIYPAVPTDPLLALLQDEAAKKSSAPAQPSATAEAAPAQAASP